MIKIIIVAILNQCCTDNKVCVVITVAMTKRQNYLNAQFIFLYFALSFKKKKKKINSFLSRERTRTVSYTNTLLPNH